MDEQNVFLLTLIAAPEGIRKVCATFPLVKVITSEIDEGIGKDYQVVPGGKNTPLWQHHNQAEPQLEENWFAYPGVGEFGDRYFCD